MGEIDLLEIVRQRLHVKVMPPVLEVLLKSKLAQYPNPLLAQETADQLNEKGLVEIDEITGQGNPFPLPLFPTCVKLRRK